MWVVQREGCRLGWYTANLWFSMLMGVESQLLVWVAEVSAMLICCFQKVGGCCLNQFRACLCSLGYWYDQFDFLSNGNPILYCLRWSGHVICHFVLSELAGRFLALVDRRLFRGWSPSYSFLHLIVIYSGKFVRVCFVLSSEFCCWWLIHWSFE